jgi:hypothetical protein
MKGDHGVRTGLDRHDGRTGKAGLATTKREPMVTDGRQTGVVRVKGSRPGVRVPLLADSGPLLWPFQRSARLRYSARR